VKEKENMAFRILVSGGSKTLRRPSARPECRPYLGHLVVPGNRNDPAKIAATGLPIACDNGAFTRFDEAAFARMVRAYYPFAPAWIAVPDLVCNSYGSIGLFSYWTSFFTQLVGIDLAGGDLALALVLQDGMEDRDWDWWFRQAACVFIGGSTAWKLSAAACGLVQEAILRNLWVHMGRVNSIDRLLYAAEIGCHSVDGMSWNRFGDTYLPGGIRALMDFYGDPLRHLVQPVPRSRRALEVA
jgi:hypothetical protein